MEKSSKIYVAGHNGLVGSAITKCLIRKGYTNFIFRNYSELDLTDQKAVDSFFEKERPDFVFLAAALVGGIIANNTYRADFIYNNTIIQANVIYSCWKYKVKKLLFLGSTCIYPKNAPQPLKEEYLLTSGLEYTNEPYAIAKIAGLKMCESYNIQYGTNFISVMPTNLYGEGDNYDLEKSHVLPALMRKIHLGKCLEENNWTAIRKDLGRNPIENADAGSEESIIIDMLRKYGVQVLNDSPVKESGSGSDLSGGKLRKVTVKVWGSGTPLREFMYSSDLAEACVFVMENVNVNDIIELNKGEKSEYNAPHFINIGTGEEISIKDLALRIKNLTGFKGEIVFDLSKPDGTMRKTIDIQHLKQLGFHHRHDLDNGLAESYKHYLK